MPQKTDGLRILSMSKGEQIFIFKYQLGEEKHVLAALTDAVRSRNTTFDVVDAAILSHQLGQNLTAALKSYAPKKAL